MFKNQIELFKYCWEHRPHYCFVTGEKLDKFINSNLSLSMFAHVLSKRKYPEWRLYQNNIILLSPNFEGSGYSIHHLFDNGSLDEILKFEKLSGKSFRILFEFERKSHSLYSCEFKKILPERKIIDSYLKKNPLTHANEGIPN